MDKLDSLPQEMFDENRSRFDAGSSSFDVKNLEERCQHKFERISYSQIQCKKCSFGLTDNNRFILEDGKISGIK